MLVGWKGLPAFEATREIFDDFNQRFLDYHIENKVVLEEEGNVKPPILLTYSRKDNKGKGLVCGSVATERNG